LVNLASVILVSGIGLALFFSKDIVDFLNSLKGFGQLPEGFGEIPPLPAGGLIEAGTDVVFGAGTTKKIGSGLEQTREEIFKAGVGTQEAIFQAGVETRKTFDKGIIETQKALEETGKAIVATGEAIREPIFKAGVETQKTIAGVGEEIFQAGVATRTAFDQSIENISKTFEQGGSAIFSFFGGQSQPKMILTQPEATQEVKPAITLAGITQAEILSGGTPTKVVRRF
jgi:hypothetical protein